jgi:hypothetical protein
MSVGMNLKKGEFNSWIAFHHERRPTERQLVDGILQKIRKTSAKGTLSLAHSIRIPFWSAPTLAQPRITGQIADLAARRLSS